MQMDIADYGGAVGFILFGAQKGDVTKGPAGALLMGVRWPREKDAANHTALAP